MLVDPSQRAATFNTMLRDSGQPGQVQQIKLKDKFEEISSASFLLAYKQLVKRETRAAAKLHRQHPKPAGGTEKTTKLQ